MLVPLSRSRSRRREAPGCSSRAAAVRRDRHQAMSGRDEIGLRDARRTSVGPRELYGATRSSLRRLGVERSVTAPTVIADGALPGDTMPA